MNSERDAPGLQSRGGLGPSEVRAEITRLARAQKGDADAPLLVRTEPHALDRYSFLDGVEWPVLNLQDLRPDQPGWPRRKRAREAHRRVHDRLASSTPGAVVFDTTEAWLATSLFHIMRTALPSTPLVGLQHGVMQKTGLESLRAARLLRRWIAGVEFRLTGYNRVGAGFGNLPFDFYVCYGHMDAEYIRRLHPRTATRVAFRALQRLEPGPLPREKADVLFLAQDLAPYGVRDGAQVYTAVLRRLEAVAMERGWRAIVKRHPKAPLPVDLASVAPALEEAGSVPVSALLAPRHTIAVSFNSTALLEAAFLNCPIVAIRVPDVSGKWYAMFHNPIPLKDFVTTWTGDRMSALRAGVID